MAVLLLKLVGPLQSWGSDSRFTERKTQHEPTKSGVVGLLAAALGRRREDSVSDLVALRFGVRIDQPGSYERDFQTEHTRVWDKGKQRWVFRGSLPLSHRYYLADAVFVAAFEGDDELVRMCAEALECPVFPLYLGRRSCPPSGKILLGIEEDMDLLEALQLAPWQSTDHYRRQWRIRKKEEVKLEILYDKGPSDQGEGYDVSQQDVPISFSQVYRQYTWRTVAHATTTVRNPSYMPQSVEHDPLAAIDGVVS
ncbi:type I-E CRISPR-associated protein Cas5/CasD [Olsenella uli]